jgi:hypothetical protein
MISSKLYSRNWLQWVTLALEWINWAMFTTILKGMAFTISGKTYCVAPGGGRYRSPPCNAIYAILVFSSVDTILMTISVAFVMYAVEVDRRRRRRMILNAEYGGLREN